MRQHLRQITVVVVVGIMMLSLLLLVFSDDPPLAPDGLHGRRTETELQRFVRSKKHAVRPDPPMNRVMFAHMLNDVTPPPCKFTQAVEPQPVHEDPDLINYANHPLSKFRPSQQFCHFENRNNAILTIVTATHNPSATLRQTAEMIHHQSLANYHWIIVNDHSSLPASLELLKELARHPKVTVIENLGARGLPNGRNVGLSHVRSKYVGFLDDDDMLELTAYEKLVWTLESCTNIDIAAFYMINFGGRNFTWTAGFHEGYALFTDNRIPVASLVRTSVLNTIQFNPDLVNGMEDWDFWLTIMESGSYGYTTPEFLMWYRTREESFRRARWPGLFENHKKTSHGIKKAHASLASSLPYMTPTHNSYLERTSWDTDWENDLTQSDDRPTMLLLLPWLFRGGVETLMLKIVKLLSEAGWKVSIISTMHKGPMSVEMRPEYMKYTHDVFTLPTMLRLRDYPRFIRYFIKSRKIKVVMISNCQLAYELLPLLKPQFPHVKFVDMIHSEVEEWRNGGYPMYSALNARYLDLTLAVSQHVANWVPPRAQAPTNVKVFYVGVQLPPWKPASPNQMAQSITMVARMDIHKRPIVAVDAIHNAISRVEQASDTPVEIVGGGAMLETVRSHCAGRPHFHIHGSLEYDAVKQVLERSQLFVLTSDIEGTSVAVAEAMAHGVPVIVTNAGAMDELVGDSAFAIIKLSGSDDTDRKAFEAAIEEFLRLPISEKRAWGMRARKQIEDKFDSSKTLPVAVNHLNALLFQNDMGRELVPVQPADPDPLLHYVLMLSLATNRHTLNVPHPTPGPNAAYQEDDLPAGIPNAPRPPSAWPRRALVGVTILCALVLLYLGVRGGNKKGGPMTTPRVFRSRMRGL